MKRLLFILVFMLAALYTYAWQQNEDSLSQIINLDNDDKAKVDALVYIAFQQQQVDFAIHYAQQGLLLAKKLHYKKGEADCQLVFQRTHAQQGNFNKAIQSALDALSIYTTINHYVGSASAHAMLQALYRDFGDYRNSLIHAFSALQIAETYNTDASFLFPGHRWAPLILAEIGQTYVLMHKPDSALLYIQRSIAHKELFNGAEWGFPVYLLATIRNMKGQYKTALETYRSALHLSVQNKNLHDTLQIFSGMSTLFKNMGEQDSAIHYAQIVAQGWQSQSEFKNLLEAVSNLAQVYKAKGNSDSALKYTERSFAIKDSIFSAENHRDVQRIAFVAKLKEEELKAAQIKYRSKVQLLVLTGGLLTLFLISGVLWRSNRQKQKAKAKIEQAYSELKATQAQLIQKEKMASLGELIAGIAHEIQNPLNFVNNFSETNNELLEEAQTEIKTGHPDEVYSLLSDIRSNNDKINHHGKRADSIVKGMMQHARTNTGEKQLTDVNALTDEYLRLAYHGLRAKDKAFNAKIETYFDETKGKIEVIPQDIGKVLLNLYNNAFYAVHEKVKKLGNAYEPRIWVSTKNHKDKIEIRVKDNGMGISESLVDKIFQPFFTTKPTGQGTGLGLSLSYDIVKAHGGELKVESTEGEGATFTIVLPLNPTL